MGLSIPIKFLTFKIDFYKGGNEIPEFLALNFKGEGGQDIILTVQSFS